MGLNTARKNESLILTKMKALLQFPRTLYNVLFLRGRRRVTKLLLLLVLGGLVMAVVKEGVCTVHPELCQNGDIHPDMFQVSKRGVQMELID